MLLTGRSALPVAVLQGWEVVVVALATPEHELLAPPAGAVVEVAQERGPAHAHGGGLGTGLLAVHPVTRHAAQGGAEVRLG